jgi:hypothetical protein
MAWWVFYLLVINRLRAITVHSSKRAGGEVANARVCKTCIRGFNSRPALHVSDRKTKPGRLQMSNRTTTPRKNSLLDVYAVALALALALLVRFNLLPAIKW